MAVAQAVDVLEQLEHLLGSLADTTYARSCPGVFGSCIGKHTRHVLDHFAALLAPADAACDRLVDYDHRQRETAIETSVSDAAAEVRRLCGVLRAMTDQSGLEPVTVRAMVDRDGRCVDMPSSFARELAFASHHALHHQAMIRLIGEAFGVTIDPTFGKAPSTLHHEHSTAGENGQHGTTTA